MHYHNDIKKCLSYGKHLKCLFLCVAGSFFCKDFTLLNRYENKLTPGRGLNSPYTTNTGTPKHLMLSFAAGALIPRAKPRCGAVARSLTAWGGCAEQTEERPLGHPAAQWRPPQPWRLSEQGAPGRDVAPFALGRAGPEAALSAGMVSSQTGQSHLVKPTWNQLCKICSVPMLFI